MPDGEFRHPEWIEFHVDDLELMQPRRECEGIDTNIVGDGERVGADGECMPSVPLPGILPGAFRGRSYTSSRGRHLQAANGFSA